MQGLNPEFAEKIRHLSCCDSIFRSKAPYVHKEFTFSVAARELYVHSDSVFNTLSKPFAIWYMPRLFG